MHSFRSPSRWIDEGVNVGEMVIAGLPVDQARLEELRSKAFSEIA
jgi:hypothetical protein